jgi:hypothetical protein
MTFPIQSGLVVAVFAATTAVAAVAGAANHGTAKGVGQIAFTAALLALLLRR